MRSDWICKQQLASPMCIVRNDSRKLDRWYISLFFGFSRNHRKTNHFWSINIRLCRWRLHIFNFILKWLVFSIPIFKGKPELSLPFGRILVTESWKIERSHICWFKLYTNLRTYCIFYSFTSISWLIPHFWLFFIEMLSWPQKIFPWHFMILI